MGGDFGVASGGRRAPASTAPRDGRGPADGLAGPAASGEGEKGERRERERRERGERVRV